MIVKCVFMYLLLTGERFSPGVGQVNATDEIKREIIHQLSIKPMAHSELVKSLPEDVSTYSLKEILQKSFPVSLVCIDLLLYTFPTIVKNYSSRTCLEFAEVFSF